MTATTRVRRAEVVVPAHDEEGLVGRCVAGLAAAVGHARAHGLDAWVTLVLDACRDATGTVAAEAAARAGLDLTVVELDACAVGRAREAGVAAVRARLAREAAVADEEVWLLHTDADSVVGHDWIVEHVRLADAGADVVVGTVRPDPADLGPERTRAWAATRVPGRPNGHVHGANLGLRLSAHLAAGGFDPVVAHEDVGLVARLRALPVAIVASDVVDVLTSGRTEGRAPHGYAQYLRETLVPPPGCTTASSC